MHIFYLRDKKIRTKYSPEFKVSVIMDMRKNNLGYHETVRKYNLENPNTGGARKMLHNWERIYLEEGAAGLAIERRGRTRKVDNPKKGKPRKKPINKQIENDLIAENQKPKEQVEISKWRTST